MGNLWKWIISEVIPWVWGNRGQAGIWANGLVTFILAVAAVRDKFVHRERLKVKLLSLTQYVWSWNERDVGRCDAGPYNGAIKEGDPRRIFAVLEFVICNAYKTNVSIGRFIMQDWMYAAGYRQFMYARHRDYRVFDLFTRGRVSLDEFRLVEPGHEFGLRVEIFEQGYDPAHNFPQHRPAVVHLPDQYVVQFHADKGKKQQQVFRVQDHQRVWFDDRHNRRKELKVDDVMGRPEESDSLIYRWSDDMIPASEVSSVRPPAIPQAMSTEGWSWPEVPSWRGFDHALGVPGGSKERRSWMSGWRGRRSRRSGPS